MFSGVSSGTSESIQDSKEGIGERENLAEAKKDSKSVHMILKIEGYYYYHFFARVLVCDLCARAGYTVITFEWHS